MRSVLRREIALFLALAGLLGIAVLAYSGHNRARARMIGFYLSGRAGACSLPEALDSLRVTAAQETGSQRLATACHLIQKDARGYTLWDTPRGRYWMPTGSDGGLFYDLAEQDRKIYGDGATGVQSGDVVLDCGANVGVFTREALNRGARLVVSVEPAPENVECLRRNFALEIGQGRVVVYPKGVWNKDEMLPIHVDPHDSARDSFLNAHDTVVRQYLPLTTVDRLTAELKLARIDFIKMDIEGAERKALAGAVATIRKFKPRLAICVYHLPDDPVLLPNLVRAAIPSYRQSFQCLTYADHVQAEVAHFF